MDGIRKYAVVGGDLRQACLANALANRVSDGAVYGMYLDKDVELADAIVKTNDLERTLPGCDVVIFPLPISGNGQDLNTPFSSENAELAECFRYIRPESHVLGGMISEAVRGMAKSYGFGITDYFQREELAVLNAVPTAEGAIEIALRELPTTIFGQTCLITGYGRISKVLSRLLLAFGAKVKVAARRYDDLAWCRIHGCEAVPISALEEHLNNVQIVFNTVPAVLLDEKHLAKLDPSCLVVDLASKPGGVDFETARNLGVKVIWALSLPGKVAPVSAGEILLDTIMNILNE